MTLCLYACLPQAVWTAVYRSDKQYSCVPAQWTREVTCSGGAGGWLASRLKLALPLRYLQATMFCSSVPHLHLHLYLLDEPKGTSSNSSFMSAYPFFFPSGFYFIFLPFPDRLAFSLK